MNILHIFLIFLLNMISEKSYGSDGKVKSSLCKAREPKQRAHSPLLEAGLASESKTD